MKTLIQRQSVQDKHFLRKMANKNADRFMRRVKIYFQVIGFEFERTKPWLKYVLIGGLINMGTGILGQFLFVGLSNADLQVKTAGITYLNYFLVSVGKIIALIYHQKTIHATLNEFREMYPSIKEEKTFSLQKYLKTSVLIGTILEIFFLSISFFYNFYPLGVSVRDLNRDGVFTYNMPLMEWFPFEIYGSWSLYALTSFHQIIATYNVGIIILGLDICLFSSLLQLCMHFDLINQKIIQIEPDKSEDAEKRLKELIARHQKVLRLAENVNHIFTPSVLFSLLSSSFIICFTGYQLLGDISLMIVFRAIILLGYEMKQVVITCVLGDRLMEISLKVSDVIYEHKWYNGTPKYKRLVLVVLARSQKSAALNIAGISSVTLQTLRSVMSISYQIFTVLKTS